MDTKSLGSEAGDLFWPGFVDAISCLVLNLLFLTMVLTIAVFVLGQGQALHRREALASVAADKPAPASAPAQPAPPALPAPAIKAAPTPVPLPASVAPEPVRAEQAPVALKSDNRVAVNGDVRVGEDGTSDALLLIIFSSDTVIVPSEQRDALVQRLRALDEQQPGQTYEVRVATDTTISDARRSAYFRAISVRDLMMQAGIRPLSITLRMQSKGLAGGEGVVRIYRRQE